MKKVKAISFLGSTYDCIVIDDNFIIDGKLKEFFKNTNGIEKYALVYDLEFDQLDVKKWGYDLFSKKDYLIRFKSLY